MRVDLLIAHREFMHVWFWHMCPYALPCFQLRFHNPFRT